MPANFYSSNVTMSWCISINTKCLPMTHQPINLEDILNDCRITVEKRQSTTMTYG